VREFELDVDGHRLHCYDTGATSEREERLVVIWHHGTPNIGTPPRPLFEASERLGIRWLSYDRPGYGGSTRRVGRDIASAANDAAAVADAAGIDRFAVMGHSGGGPHALACAALLGDRVIAAVSGAGLAPYGADGLDWYDGMEAAAAASLRAAAEGRDTKERYEATAREAQPPFIPADFTALEGTWGWFGEVVRPALAHGPAGLIDDDLAYVGPWGFDPADVAAPALILHGTADCAVPSSHAEWLAARVPGAVLWLRPGEGHISVLESAPAALAWLRERADAVLDQARDDRSAT
jgi:pimeloyl-ACP methyl ester carboxylesterase